MPSFTASAPGKAILYGEHAVVYNRPAIAIPVNQLRARAVVSPAPEASPGSVELQAPNIGLLAQMEDLPEDHPLRAALELAFSALGIARSPACRVRITSSIPVAAGLGSGAAVSVALLRAFSAFVGRPFSDDQVCGLAYEVEKLYHGTPSGIDNTVITYAKPVYYQRGEPIQPLQVSASITFVIADTGIASPTAITVGDVRAAWQASPQALEPVFDAIGAIARSARRALESGELATLGALMDENHAHLQRLGVSCPELDQLVEAARTAGALGAKLSGGGRGGNLIALVKAHNCQPVQHALIAAGAVRTLVTTLDRDRNSQEIRTA